jgi:tetratricopeptide (TPR) repeat protein
MRADVWPVQLGSTLEETFSPAAEAPPGFASLTPLVRALLGALNEPWQGTVLVHDASAEPIAALRFEAGWIVTGHVSGAEILSEAIAALCARTDIHVALVAHEEAEGAGPEITTGRIDALALTAAVVRAGWADACVVGAVQAIGQKAIKRRVQRDLGRYQLQPDERAAVAQLKAGAATLEELRERARVPELTLHRLVYTLWLTHAITIVPTWLRVVSHAVPRAGRRNDEPTAIMPLDGGQAETGGASRSGRAPKRHSELRAGLPNDAQPTAAPGRYHHLAPAHCSSEVVGFARPPDLAHAPPEQQNITAYAQADAYFRTAELLLGRGYPREAVFEAQKALRLCRPRPDQQAFYAWLLYQRSGAGKRVHQHVWDHLEQALRAEPQCERAHFYRALLLEQTR